MYKDSDGKWLKSFGGVLTPSYQVWYSMMQRCILNGRIQNKYPTYQGCTTSKEFEDFQYFADWYSKQVGYGLPDYDLDKDILFPDNKLYSEDTCVLIPHALNIFFIAKRSENGRGAFPQGVTYQQSAFKYKASISCSGVAKYLGIYETAEEAFQVYKVAKEAEARRWYERLSAGEFIVDPRVIERMRVWTLV